MQKALSKIDAVDTQIVAISYDPVDTLAKFAETAKITFPLLADDQSTVIDAYGIRNADVAGDDRLDGIPHPGTFIVGKDGTIEAKIFNKGYIKRHTGGQLVKEIQKLE